MRAACVARIGIPGVEALRFPLESIGAQVEEQRGEQHAAKRLSVEDGVPVRVRAGIHAGDLIGEGGDLHGISVITASRTADHAAGGDILVSDVVRQLVAGTGFAFSERETFVPKGFDQPFDVYRIEWDDTAQTTAAGATS